MNVFFARFVSGAIAAIAIMLLSASALGCGGTVERLDARLDARVVYFAKDSAEVSSESHDLLRAHARFLHEHRSARMELIGHTDHSINGDYAVAIGERQAKAIKQFLDLHGAWLGQVEVVSRGSERPAELGEDEESQSKNRRVEIRYTTGGPEFD